MLSTISRKMANSMIPIINPGRVDARHLSMNVPSNCSFSCAGACPSSSKSLPLPEEKNRTPIRN